MSDKAPRGIRLVITLAGRRNSGKSSLINGLAGQDIAIVSDTPGTTTDPVAKHYELLPLGPVTFYDTAGIDDVGDLGEMRVRAARKVLYRTDVALAVIGEQGITEYDREFLVELQHMKVPFIAVFNKVDLKRSASQDLEWCAEQHIPHVEVSALNGQGIRELKEAVVDLVPAEMRNDPVLAGDLISEGDTVLCVVPIDLAAPKGRLILPQVQVLREVLDCDAMALTVKERELEAALANLKQPPALVVTDSQVVLQVAGDVPEDIPLTTFSTLFARCKGDLPRLVRGAGAVDRLEDGDKVLIGEACSHHATADDIGRVKIPRWITRYTGKDLDFQVYAGHDFPEDLEQFSLAVHCGACMLNRTEMIRRINECERRGVPVTNYGVAISKVQGVLDRIIAPFGIMGLH